MTTPFNSRSRNRDQRFSGSAAERATPEQEYDKHDSGEDVQHNDEPDVLLDVPVIKVEELNLELDDLEAHISLRAEVADLVKINVGVDAYLNHVKLQVKGVDAQATLKVRLERVLETLNRALETIDHNPQILGARPEAESGSSEDTVETTGQTEQTAHPGADVLDTAVESIPNKPSETVGKGSMYSPADSPEEQIGYDATDAARERAGELGVDLSTVEGTGSGGRILARDVVKAASQV